MVADEDEWQIRPRTTWIDRLIRWAIGAVVVFVLVLAAIGGLVVLGAVVGTLTSAVAAAAEPGVIEIIDAQSGALIARCNEPLSIPLTPQPIAVLCEQPATVYRDGFEG